MNTKSGSDAVGPSSERRVLVTVIVAFGLVLAAVGTYWTALDNEFIWDDPIIFNRQLPYFDSFKNVFSPPRSIPQFGVHYYRPLTIVTYQIDEKISATFWPESEREEARRVVYHASVVVYHAIATVLLFLFGLRLARLGSLPPPIAASVAGSAALLFAVHPIHVESVAWMAGRTDVLCAIFVLASLTTYLRYRELRRPADLICAVGFAFAAMLTKETGISVLLIVPLADLFISLRERKDAEAAERKILEEAAAKGDEGDLSVRKARRREEIKRRKGKGVAPSPSGIIPLWARYGFFVAALCVYWSLRRNALGSGGKSRTGHEIFDLFAAIGWYLRKSVWAGKQSAFVHEIPGVLDGALGIVLVAGSTAALLWFLRRRDAPGEAIAIVFVFATLAPSLAIVVFRISETPLAERYAYIPSAGVYLLAAFLIERASRLARRIAENRTLRVAAVVAPMAVLSIVGAYAALERGAVWQDDLSFWTDTAQAADGQGLPHLHLGLTFSALGYEDKALDQYKLALERYDDAEGRSKAYNNMGSLYLARGEIDAAIESLEGALRERPNYPTAHYNLAMCQKRLLQERGLSLRQKNALVSDMRKNLERAIDLNPRYVKAHLQYGRMLLSLGREPAKARGHLTEVIRLAPASREAEVARRYLLSAN